MLYALLQVAHQHEVTSLEPSVMQGVMVDVAQHGPGPYSPLVYSLVVVYVPGQLRHHSSKVLCVALGNRPSQIEVPGINLGQPKAALYLSEHSDTV